MTLAGPGNAPPPPPPEEDPGYEIREIGPPPPPHSRNTLVSLGGAILADLPTWATVRETASHLTYAEAVHVAASIHEDIKAGRLTKPYSDGVRMSLLTCAAVFSREATA